MIGFSYYVHQMWPCSCFCINPNHCSHLTLMCTIVIPPPSLQMESKASAESTAEDTAGLRNELSESNDQIATLKAQLEEAMKEKAAGQEALGKLEASLEQLQGDVGQHKQDLDEAKKENATLSEELEKEKANHEQYLQFKASTESEQKEQTRKLNDDVEKLSEDNKTLREEANQAKIELDIAAKAGSELAAKVKSLEEALSDKKAKAGKNKLTPVLRISSLLKITL